MAPPPPPPKGKGSRTHTPGKAAIAISPGAVSQHQIAAIRAFHIYVSDPDATVQSVWELGRLVEDDASSPMIRDCISHEWLRTIAGPKYMNWVARREAFWEDVQSRVLEYAKTDLVQRQLEEIDKLTNAGAALLQHVHGDAVAKIAQAKPRSLEGVVNAFVNLDRHITKKREVAIAAAAAAAKNKAGAGATGPGRGAAPPIEDGMSDAEVATMARDMARKRAGLMIEEGSDGE